MNGQYCLITIVSDIYVDSVTMIWDDPNYSLAEVAFSVFSDMATHDRSISRGMFLRVDDSGPILLDQWTRKSLDNPPDFSEPVEEAEDPISVFVTESIPPATSKATAKP